MNLLFWIKSTFDQMFRSRSKQEREILRDNFLYVDLDLLFFRAVYESYQENGNMDRLSLAINLLEDRRKQNENPIFTCENTGNLCVNDSWKEDHNCSCKPCQSFEEYIEKTIELDEKFANLYDKLNEEFLNNPNFETETFRKISQELNELIEVEKKI